MGHALAIVAMTAWGQSITEGSLQQHDDNDHRLAVVGFTEPNYWDDEMTFTGAVTDLSYPDALQIEIKHVDQPFDGLSGVYTGNYVNSGAVSRVTLDGIQPGSYKWRARATTAFSTSSWVEFGGNPEAEMDFRILSETEYFSDDGGGGCGMIGLEAVLLLGVALVLRGRR